MAAEAKPAGESPEPRPPLGVALELDLSGRPDALLALALLNGLAARGAARRISLSVTRASLSDAQLADVLAEFYAILPEGAGGNTIGMPEAAPGREHPAISALLARKAPSGAPLYPSQVRRVVDTADGAVLLRNTLLAQLDGDSVVLLAGAATALARLLDLHGARAQLSAKVRQLVVAAGSFPAGAAEPTVASDVAAFRKLFAQWPTPLIAVGAELGQALRVPVAQLQRGLASSPPHPVAAAYAAIAPAQQHAPTGALAALLHAVHPDAGFFQLSEPGVISVLDDGRTPFTPRAQGPHRYLIADPAQQARLAALYAELIAAPPVPRPVRRRPGMIPAEQQKAAEQKPAEQKPAPAAPPKDAARP